ncbi:MAG: hypothetical protein A4E64_02805 [Syntrophorhabdus sp. PtaU1.Bin058]|nr:MAG: hypothetical protein A4E64_02805 [Syntrophorhabdus sp. PtaU1.Bin058]
MKISTAIEEGVPGALRVVSDGIRQKKSDRDLYDNNIDRTPRIVQRGASGLDLKHTECKVVAFDCRPVAAADQEYTSSSYTSSRYVSSRQVAGQYEIDKVSLQIPRIVTDKYREAEEYKRPAVSTLQIYA